MVPAIHLAQVPHERGEGCGIGVAVGGAERGEQFDAAATLDLDTQKPFKVPFHPVRRVTGQAVLPARKPEEAKAQVVTPCRLDDPVHDGEVEFALLRLDLSPGNTCQDSVQFRFLKLGPQGLHVLQAGGAVVAQFSRQRQKGFAVNNQLCRRALFSQMRDIRFGLRVCLAQQQPKTSQRSADCETWTFHNMVPHGPQARWRLSQLQYDGLAHIVHRLQGRRIETEGRGLVLGAQYDLDGSFLQHFRKRALPFVNGERTAPNPSITCGQATRR